MLALENEIQKIFCVESCSLEFFWRSLFQILVSKSSFQKFPIACKPLAINTQPRTDIIPPHHHQPSTIMSDDFEGEAAELIPADVRMISGCLDRQTAADVSNVSAFKLPDPAGRSGGACTSALLKVLYNHHHKNDKNLSFVQVLTIMRQILDKGRYKQIPQLSASRKMDVNDRFELIPSGVTGTKRAVLIGINYVGQRRRLSGCHNDVENIKDYLVGVEGFVESNITVLMVSNVATIVLLDIYTLHRHFRYLTAVSF
jgi:hypothetical protein